MTVELHRSSFWVKVELVGRPSLVAPVTADSGEAPGLAPAAPGSAQAAYCSSPPGCQLLPTTRPLRWTAPGAAVAPRSVPVEVRGPRGSNVPLLSRGFMAKHMWDRLKELEAPQWGAKQQMWSRLLEYGEVQHEQEDAEKVHQERRLQLQETR